MAVFGQRGSTAGRKPRACHTERRRQPAGRNRYELTLAPGTSCDPDPRSPARCLRGRADRVSVRLGDSSLPKSRRFRGQLGVPHHRAGSVFVACEALRKKDRRNHGRRRSDLDAARRVLPPATNRLRRFCPKSFTKNGPSRSGRAPSIRATTLRPTVAKATLAHSLHEVGVNAFYRETRCAPECHGSFAAGRILNAKDGAVLNVWAAMNLWHRMGADRKNLSSSKRDGHFG